MQSAPGIRFAVVKRKEPGEFERDEIDGRETDRHLTSRDFVGQRFPIDFDLMRVAENVMCEQRFAMQARQRVRTGA